MRLCVSILSILLLSSIYNAALIEPDTISKGIENAVLSLIQASISGAILLLNVFIAYNPSVPDVLAPLHSQLLKLIAPLYLIILTWNGIQIMTSETISTQANARITLQNTLVSMVLVASSLPLYKLLINLSQFTASYFNAAPFSEPGRPELATSFIFSLILLMMLVFLVFLIVRFFFVSLGVVLLPIGAFLYFFSPTKRYGKSLLSLIAFFLFIQIIISLVIAVMNVFLIAPPTTYGLGIFEAGLYRCCVILGGLFLLVSIPFMIIVQIVLASAFPEIKLLSFIMGMGASVKNVEQ